MNKYLKVMAKVRVHPITWLVMGIAVLTAHFQQLIMLLIVVFFHEMGHAWMATRYKWRIKSITLLPFGGVMETEEYGNRSIKEEVNVIVFGPLQHLWLFALAYGLFAGGFLSEVSFLTFAYMNASICLFNLLPLWPLDGGKLLFLFLSIRLSFLKSHKWMLQFSLLFIMLLVPLSIWLQQFSLNMCIIMAFLLFSIAMEWKQRHYIFMRFLLERHYGKNKEVLQLKPIRVDENEKLYSLLQYFQRGCKHPVIVTNQGKEKGALDETEVLHAYFTEKRTGDKVGDLLYSY
ncbi:M50 family metallopeptidase [Bacillus testis]|uniref:M50 family metallopeptidase n=1 Tax=Bacillus testis TaxID=1622072 RepID=UPI00067EBA4E|nr:M50 family metallopeptidase [Bacillus testis]